MNTTQPVRIYVAGINGIGSHFGRPPEDDDGRVHLEVHYGQKQAQIELPAGVAQFEREPGVEAYRRELQDLIAALQEAVASPQGIQWPYHPRT